MTLVECSSIHGNTTLFEHDPDCGVFYNALYMPVHGHNPAQGRSFGLYQPDGSLIRAAGRFRGPDGAVAGPLLHCRYDRGTLAPALDGASFFYLGAFTSHYGHFLIDSLCRLWALSAWRGDRKILYHGFETPSDMFKIPFVAEIFSACGLVEADFVKFDEPVLLGQVVVPSPAIEELNYAHRCLATCFKRIGELICPVAPRETQDAPVYLTKAMVTSGVSHYVNEWDFVARLERDGIQIIAPETLPLREQIQLFRSRGIVAGLIGSAFHTALFAPPRDVLILNYEPVVWSNQILIDNASGGRSTFVCEAGGSRNEGPDGRFDNNFRMSDPTGLAEQFLRRIDGLNRAAHPAPATGRFTAPLRVSCAVVLVVKDEAHDIAAWLAWHHVLGFDACIVYDDDSTDGTWDILRTASSVQDIRLSRTVGKKSGPYEHRQDECYRRALRDYGKEFDWLAFFDADEFLLLNQDSDVKRFLARFPEADAVAINWCNYGSSFHIVKPDAPVFDAFTWHGGRHQHVNRHVKSIVRPAKVGTQWHNVHCFDVPAERYALSNGQSPIWSETPGIIDGDPDWEMAKLMHYQCRSMEHFVERMKKRPALSAVRGIWHACDLQDVQSSIPEQCADAVKAQMRRLSQPAPAPAPVPEAVPIPPGVIFVIGMSNGDDAEFRLAQGFRVVGVEPDIQTYLGLCERFDAALKTGRLVIHNCAAGRQVGQIVTFHPHNKHQATLRPFNDRLESPPGTYESYPVLTIDWPTLRDKHGTPHFVKIAIEGNEAAFLEGMVSTDGLPEYISVECRRLAPLEMLYDLGYRHFKLVDRTRPAWRQASGPFGRDLPGEWVDFGEFKQQWLRAEPDDVRIGFDCHAWFARAEITE